MMDNKLVQKFMQQVEEVVSAPGDRELLFEALKRYQSSSDVKKLVQDLKRVLNDPTRLEVYDHVRPLIRPQHQQTYDKITPSAPGTRARLIKLRRRANESLGFAVRGGFEHGIGIFVSHVEKGSQAEQKGLKMGDEIVRINGFTIAEAIHDEVLNLIKGRDEIELKVTSIGMVPIKQSPTDPVTWQYVDKTPFSKQQSTGAQQPENENITKIFINMHGAQSLGCSIVSGPKQFPGIYIETLRPGGMAEKYQLEVGDQILEVNGKSFQDIKHKEAIVELKGSKELNMVIKKQAGIALFKMKKTGQSPAVGKRQVVAADIEHHPDEDSADLISNVLDQDEQADQERQLWNEEQERIKQDKEIAELRRREEERKREELKQAEERQVEIERREMEKQVEIERREIERQAEIERREMERQAEIERRDHERQEELEREERERQLILERRKKENDRKLREEQERQIEQERQKEEEKQARLAKNLQSAVLAGRSGARSSLKPKLLGAASLSKSSFGSLTDKVVKDVTITKMEDIGLDIEIEGGLGSPLGGKIVVADIYPGGLVDMTGEVKKGDKLLKVNNQSISNMPLSDAQEILWKAEQSSQATIILTVEESEFRNNENEMI